MRVALFGTTGQVATELRRRRPDGVELKVIGRDRADFAIPDQVHDAARALRADAVINAAAYTAVDDAEHAQNMANAVNGVSVKALAQACRDQDRPLVHISTDYVFDGAGVTPWRPDDPARPLGAYGRSKLLGEAGIRETGLPHAILRTSWVFSAQGRNFVKTMLRLSATNDRVDIVADQIGGPTPAAAIADALYTIARALASGRGASGTYHFAGAPDVSWADFAREIFAQSHRAVTVVDIATSGYPTPAQRPANSRLDCSGTETVFGLSRPDWRTGLAKVLVDLQEIS